MATEYAAFQSTLRNMLLTSGVGVTVIGFARAAPIRRPPLRLALFVLGGAVLAFSALIGEMAYRDFQGVVPDRWLLLARSYAALVAALLGTWAAARVL